MGQLIHTNFYQSIRDLIQNGRHKTYQIVNLTMLHTYWNVGRMIVEEEQEGKVRAIYGKKLIPTLAKQLTEEFGKGFDQSNLRNMRLFFNAFPIRDAVRHELTWTHYRSIIRVSNKKARAFYINESIENQWSTRQLSRQINSFYYERLLSSQIKEPVIKEAKQKNKPTKPEDLIKDPYVWEFLGFKPNTSFLEKELESALIDKLQSFLLELGKGFSFVGRQERITTSNNHFYIDLVFYNYYLKCFVLFDLKIGELTHKDIGQMDFYNRYYEENKKVEGDNPTIGIILCSEKDETVVKYSILKDNEQLFASRYLLYLPSEEELKAKLNYEINQLKLEKKLSLEEE